MALYSWFGKSTSEHNKKTLRVNKQALKAPEPSKYIENYTMWPTAKIRKEVSGILPTHDSIKKDFSKEFDTKKPMLEKKFIPLDPTLIVTK